jgi:hypothetical protein
LASKISPAGGIERRIPIQRTCRGVGV